LLLSIGASGADLDLHQSCSDIIIACVAENINMVLQALDRIHHIGQLRFQRIWIP
jgi:SNF2 family DNA or RNA helicase